MRAFALFSLLFPTVALADQCAWIDEAVAKKAVEVLTPGTEWLAWCEPCGEARPTEARRVGLAAAVPVDGQPYTEVKVDGEAVDLAYVFVRTRAEKPVFTNLASLAGCPATDVSRTTRLPSAGR